MAVQEIHKEDRSNFKGVTLM